MFKVVGFLFVVVFLLFYYLLFLKKLKLCVWVLSLKNPTVGFTS